MATIIGWIIGIAILIWMFNYIARFLLFIINMLIKSITGVHIAYIRLKTKLIQIKNK